MQLPYEGRGVIGRGVSKPISRYNEYQHMSLLNVRFDSLRAEKRTYGLLFGLLAGFVFSFTVWGVDAIVLTRAHGMYPWLKFIIGGVPVMLVGSLAGWLSYRFNNLLASFLLWLGAGLFFSWISAHLPFEIIDCLLGIINPEIGAIVDYPFLIGASARAFIIFVAVTGLTTLAGMLHTNLVESASTGSAPLTRILPFVIWIGLFYLAGLAPDNNVYQEMRDPVVAVDQLIQFAIDTKGMELDPQVIREMRYGAVRGILDQIEQPRKLILADFDETLAATHVVVEFEDSWASCYLIESLPSNCAPATYEGLVAEQE